VIAFEDIRRQIGKGGDQLMPVFFDSSELDRIGEKLERFRTQVYQRKYLPMARAFPCVRSLFQRITDAGQRIALASSGKADELAIYKKMAQIEDLVSADTSADDAERSKPHPDIFEAALSRLSVPADRALVVGDTPYDVEAAAKIGLRSIGVLCGGFPREDLKAAGCIAIYRDPEDLLCNYARSPIAGTTAPAAHD
jgi:HAD superfamily hydrolase (TIGR01509 family)